MSAPDQSVPPQAEIIPPDEQPPPIKGAGNVIDQLALAWRLLGDERIPFWQKIFPMVGAAYMFIFPDLIGQIPVIDELDDLAIVSLAIYLMVRVAPKEVVQEHLRQLKGK
jgi:uncharacterized membrane protein YkvA (DUF1232 family)